jgi:hypothetical protein
MKPFLCFLEFLTSFISGWCFASIFTEKTSGQDTFVYLTMSAAILFASCILTIHRRAMKS